MSDNALPRVECSALLGDAAQEPCPDCNKRSGPVGGGGAPTFHAEDVTLYLGDCREIAPHLAGVDAIVSDPPYGMDWDTNYSRFRPGKNGHGGRILPDRPPIEGDDEPFDPRPWLKYPRVVLWGANHYAARLPVGTTLVWLKRHDAGFGSFLSDAEIGWMNIGHGVYAKRDLSMNAETRTRCHPTQKPIALMAWCMDRAKVPAEAVVLDPYMGSGTTGIACLRTGRRFVGIELNPEHFGNAVRRIRDELTGSLFLGGGGAEHGDGNAETRSRAASHTDPDQRPATK